MIKPDRVRIDLSFPHPITGTFNPIKIGYDYPLGPEDSDQDALDDGKRRAEEWFGKAYPPLALDMGERPSSRPERLTPLGAKKEAPQDRIASLIEAIYTCDSVKVLESYKLMVKKDPQLQAAYDQQYKKLLNA